MALDQERGGGATAASSAAPAEPSPLDTDEIPVVDLRPPTRPRSSRTLALGVMAVALAGLALGSGLVLLFHYRPLIATAHADVIDLVETSPFAFARDLHRWAGHLLLAATALHLLRVVLDAAYRPPRQSNHRLGLVLFVLLLLLGTSGYLLPWDANASWLLAALEDFGVTAGEGLLLSAFALHCGVLPILFGGLLFHHLRRARHDAAAVARAAAGDEAAEGRESGAGEN